MEIKLATSNKIMATLYYCSDDVEKEKEKEFIQYFDEDKDYAANKLDDIQEREFDESEEIRNFINTMNKEDLEKLRSSLVNIGSVDPEIEQYERERREAQKRREEQE